MLNKSIKTNKIIKTNNKSIIEIEPRNHTAKSGTQ